MVVAATPVAAPFVPDEHGVVRIGRSRVMLELLVYAYDEGLSAEEIVETYPTLDLADVYATIAYILRNRPQIDVYMAESEAAAEEILREREARFPTSELRQRIRQRAAAR